MAFSIIKNHRFSDGKKRTGLMCIGAFLGLNGKTFDIDDVDAERVILGVAAGQVQRDELVQWVDRGLSPGQSATAESETPPSDSL